MRIFTYLTCISLSTGSLHAAALEFVTTAEDQDNGATGGKSLREAIADVNDGGTIRFSSDMALIPIKLTLGAHSRQFKAWIPDSIGDSRFR